MFRYAVLNKDNVCVCVSDLSNEVIQNNMRLISNGLYPLGKKLENGTWVEVEKVENVDEIKKEKVKYSKESLEKWLELHPLESNVHNGESAFYNVTEEKQALLNQAIMTAQLKINLGLEPDITWNSTGGVCESWELEELVQLALQIEAYVKPRIKQQQTYEVQINVCTTVEEVEAIEIEYDTI